MFSINVNGERTPTKVTAVAPPQDLAEGPSYSLAFPLMDYKDFRGRPISSPLEEVALHWDERLGYIQLNVHLAELH